MAHALGVISRKYLPYSSLVSPLSSRIHKALGFTFRYVIYFELMSIRSTWFMIVFKSFIFLLIFYLIVLSITERGTLKSLTIIVD